MGLVKQARWKREAKQLISHLERVAVVAFERGARRNPTLYLSRFESDRHATLSENSVPTSSIYNLISEPPTLRFFARHASPAESAELLALAVRYDDMIAQLIALKAEQDALVARIQFAGASAREVKEVRRELKEIRKLAA